MLLAAPHGRGYGTGLIYFHHENDYWDSHVPTGSNISTPLRPIFLDLWRSNLGPEGRMPPHTQGPAFGYNNTCPSDPVRFAECATEGHCTVLGEFADHDYGGCARASPDPAAIPSLSLTLKRCLPSGCQMRTLCWRGK